MRLFRKNVRPVAATRPDVVTGEDIEVVDWHPDDEPNAPPRFTAEEMAWAASHDWYLGIHRTGRMLVRDVVRGADGVVRQTVSHLSSIEQVRRHTGY